MENIQVIQPTKLLAPYIKQYWFLRIDDVKQGFQRSIPAGCVALVFHKGNKIISSFHKGTQPQSYISGQISTYSDIEFSFLDIGKLVIYILNLFVGGKFLGQFKHFFADLLVGNTGGTSGVVPEAEQFGNGHGGNFVGYANRHGKGRTGRLET